MAKQRSFLAELKQRHVVREAIIYIAAVWALAQGISQLSPAFGLGNGVTFWFVIACVIGFPFWLVFAWFFRFTSRGIAREDETTPQDAAALHRSGRLLDYWIIGILVVAVVLLLTNELVLQRGKTLHEFTAAAASAQSIPAKSIAVLPFENLSSDKANAYFADGIQDLILTKLANIGGLKVISRTSTEQYGSHPENLSLVGQQLGVATVLEGSVQKAGDQVLINVQLINAKTDSHIWAQSYTRTLTDIFGVEGEVSAQIAKALDAKLSPAETAELAAVPTRDPAAYTLYLRANYEVIKGGNDFQSGDFHGFQSAIVLYRQAIAKDPGFALAYAKVSSVESLLAILGSGGNQQLIRQAHADLEQAQKLAPHTVATLLALGQYHIAAGDSAGALKAFKAALALRPNNSKALAAVGGMEILTGHADTGLASLQKAFALDPRNSRLANSLGNRFMLLSRYPEAANWYQRALAIDPDNLNAKSNYPNAILFQTGDVDRALAAAQGNEPTMQELRSQLLLYQRKYVKALAVLDAIPDTPENFVIFAGNVKANSQAGLYNLMGEPAKARPLYRQALTNLRAELNKEIQQHSQYLSAVWQSVADAELGLGHTTQALAAIAKSRTALAAVNAELGSNFAASILESSASLYAEAHRPDLAVPLLAKLLASPDHGMTYAPVLLWLDPSWDPIRHDRGFQALLKKYAKYKPAVTYPIPPPASGSSGRAKHAG